LRPVAYCSGCDCSIEVTCMPAPSSRPFEPIPHTTVDAAAAAANPSPAYPSSPSPPVHDPSFRNQLPPITPSPPSSGDYDQPLPAPRPSSHETLSEATNRRQRPFADDAKRAFVPWGRAGNNASIGPQQTAVVGAGSPRAAGVHSSVLRSSTVFGDREISSTSGALGSAFHQAPTSRCHTNPKP
jgi:hypothetical protein